MNDDTFVVRLAGPPETAVVGVIVPVPEPWAALLTDWRRLQSSDHSYYMSTKYFSDGDVHKYFSPYESPYDSYINFMNVLDNVRSRLKE